MISYIRENLLAEQGQRILVAVSGGVDSMVLLELLASSGFDVTVAHCNFQLRGQESLEDERLVTRWADDHGVPCHVIRFDTQQEMDRTGDPVQITARRLRYQWFRQLCEHHGYDRVAIAHHGDDSVETFFINLLRGTGLKGLTGIAKRNGHVIRPLLFSSRAEINAYAIANGIPFREDSTNRSTDYLRNKIRLQLLPEITTLAPSFMGTMAGNMNRLDQARIFVEAAMETVRARVESVEGPMVVIDPAAIPPQYPHRFVLYELLSHYGFNADTVDGIMQALENRNSGRRFLSGQYVAITDRSKIIIEKDPGSDTRQVTIQRGDSRVLCGEYAINMELIARKDIVTLKTGPNVALLDAGLIEFPLVLRKWQEGDAFVPLGMKGSKKVSDFLIDDKVPVNEKQRQLVLLSGERIAWLVGRRIDARFAVTDTTENLIRLSREPFASGDQKTDCE